MVGYEMLAEAQRDLTAEQVCLSLCLPVSRSVCLFVLCSVECSADWLEVDSDLCQPRPVHSPDSPHLALITSLLSPSPLSQSVIPSVLLQAYNLTHLFYKPFLHCLLAFQDCHIQNSMWSGLSAHWLLYSLCIQ